MENLLHNITFYEKDDGAGAGGGNPNGEGKETKTYNQDEVNGIVGTRLERERKKIYKTLGVESEDEIKKLTEERQKFLEENEKLKAENQKFIQEQKTAALQKELVAAGIEPDLVDVAILKYEEDKAMEDFIKENPKLTTEYFEAKKFKGTGGSLDNKGGNSVDLNTLSTKEFMKLSKEGKL